MWVPVLEVVFFLLGLAAGSLLKIPIRRFTDGVYPKSPFEGFLVQFLTGTGFLLTVLNTREVLDLIRLLGFFSLLMIISFIDLEKQIIPNPLVSVFLAWGLLWQLIDPAVSWSQAFFGLLLGGGFLLFAAVISRGGMGGGDIKLMGAAGFALGLPLTGLALFIGSLIGAAAGITLLLLRLKKRKDPIPFGPFLSLGIWIALLWGSRILEYYLMAANLNPFIL
jgi:leader peptidase (prepilin peptidase) / N-methyltransferase